MGQNAKITIFAFFGAKLTKCVFFYQKNYKNECFSSKFDKSALMGQIKKMTIFALFDAKLNNIDDFWVIFDKIDQKSYFFGPRI